MQVADYSKSYLYFEVDHRRAITVTTKQPIPHNQVRIQLECRCEVTPPNKKTMQFVLAASCKTEKVAVDKDIWLQPNADFCVVYSPQQFLILKRWQQCDLQIAQESETMARHLERQVGQSDDAWASHRVELAMVEATQIHGDEIVAAILQGKTVVSRTEYELPDDAHYVVEYPVKTMNVSDQYGNYQTDTGPILYPDSSLPAEPRVGQFRLAYVAHHQPDWAEFIVNVPTQLDDATHVHHYSQPVRLNVRNTVWELPT